MKINEILCVVENTLFGRGFPHKDNDERIKAIEESFLFCAKSENSKQLLSLINHSGLEHDTGEINITLLTFFLEASEHGLTSILITDKRGMFKIYDFKQA